MSNSTTPDVAFLFDMDGVLVNSMPLHTEAWRLYLQGQGMDVPDLEQRMHGRHNPDLVRDLFGNHLPETEVLAHGAAKDRLFRAMLTGDRERFLIPGVVAFLERHRNIPKALASNAEAENVDFILDRFGLRPYFRVAIDGTQMEKPKPFPDAYLRAAQLLGKTPAQCIVFEDSPAGVSAGVAANMRVVGVETTPTQFVGTALVVRDFLDPLLEPWISAQTSREERKY